ncbi:MAG TPA: (Fe-S)-binding protein, partial [Clostridiaceae bacterium]|nr:(Fe-S)-binding protein [Clostridiaceae bacterium]
LMLRCCGAPAEWAGQREMFGEAVREITHQWQELGQPSFIVACSSCYQVLKNSFPASKITSLWEIYDRIGLPEGCVEANPGTVTVHDACSTRQEKHIHESVRRILKKLNYNVEELKNSREKTECCGYGGLMCFANPELAVQVVDRRIHESKSDYLTYCTMCRDRFAAGSKRAFHMLDLIYGSNKKALAGRKGPGYSQRHENRARLKNRMLREVWREEVVELKSFEKIELELSDEVKEIMENRLILVEDIQKVIEHAEGSGNKLYNEDNGHYLASFRPVSVTYWVVYSRRGKQYIIHNAYSHRMQVSGM